MPRTQKSSETQKRVEEAFRNAAKEVEEAGRRIGRSFQDGGLKNEADRLISYLNDEIVPEIRGQSVDAVRIAAKKLSALADFMDKKRR